MNITPYDTPLRGRTTGGQATRLRIMMVSGWESNPYVDCAIRALLKTGACVNLVAREGSDALRDLPACTIHPIFPGHRNGRSYLRMAVLEIIALARVLRLVRKTRPHVVHFQSYRMIRLDWSLFLCLLLLRYKIVFTVHDTHSLEESRLDTCIFTQTARRSHLLLVHSLNAREILMGKWKVNPDRIRVVPHGGYDHYYKRQTSRSSARARLGLHSEFVLLAFGTIRPYKGLDYLLPAVAEARKSIPALRLLIAGRAFNQELGNQYRRQISDLNLGACVGFENRYIEPEEVENFFSAADLVVLPYIRIDQSGVLFLSYTFGKPVLATRLGGLPEFVREGTCGYLVRPGDSRALSTAIIKAWNNREKLAEMGLNARRLIEREYTWERQAEITLESYLSLLGADSSGHDGVRSASASHLV